MARMRVVAVCGSALGKTDDALHATLCRADVKGVVGTTHLRPAPGLPMDIILSSALLVALAEIGDKTMLLAIVLAGRFRKPAPIIAGIFTATIVNHALAALAGSAVAGLLGGFWFRLAVALGFFAMAAWILVPDTVDDDDAQPSKYGAFLTTTVAFFAAEMGDKTQVATIALGAQYHDVWRVATGTTLGMMLANVPAVFLGERATTVLPMRMVRMGAAGVFVMIGALGLWDLLLR